MKNLAAWLGVFAAVVMLNPASVPGAGEPSRGPGPAAESSAVSRPAEAELDLARLLLDRTAVPISKPLEAPAPAREPEPSAEPISSQRCRIEYRGDTGWYLLTPIAEPGQTVQPRWILPSRWLSEIEPYLARQPAPIFRVSAEPVAYKGRAFILLLSAAVDSAAESESPAIEPQPGPDVRMKPQPAKPEQAEEASSPDAIMQELLRKKPGKPIALSSEVEQVTPAESVAPLAGRQQLSEDRGWMRIDRLVTVAPESDSQWWEARFQSDNTLQDQPIRLLPCKLLEEAERIATAQAGRIGRMRITGQITQYKGRQYLLLRKVLRERDMGQF